MSSEATFAANPASLAVSREDTGALTDSADQLQSLEAAIRRVGIGRNAEQDGAALSHLGGAIERRSARRQLIIAEFLQFTALIGCFSDVYHSCPTKTDRIIFVKRSWRPRDHFA